ncbi:MAG: hypothetical protein ACXWRE_13910, partial [Pseudobdellovibrionaceae bacterium]
MHDTAPELTRRYDFIGLGYIGGYSFREGLYEDAFISTLSPPVHGQYPGGRVSKADFATPQTLARTHRSTRPVFKSDQ